MFMKSSARVAAYHTGQRGSIAIAGDAQIPPGINTLKAFREWTRSKQFPRHGKFFWLGGILWMDLKMEEASTHGLVKTAIATALNQISVDEELGEVYIDSMRISHVEADLSCEHDVMFVSYESLKSGTIHEVPGKTGVVEFEGSADAVVEIVSQSSEFKDVQDLPARLFAAGVKEYWLVDARGELIAFTIFKRGTKRFVKTPARDGRIYSNVFGHSFKLTRKINRYGRPAYKLHAW